MIDRKHYNIKLSITDTKDGKELLYRQISLADFMDDTYPYEVKLAVTEKQLLGMFVMLEQMIQETKLEAPLSTIISDVIDHS